MQEYVAAQVIRTHRRIADGDVPLDGVRLQTSGACHTRWLEDVLGDVLFIRHLRYAFDHGSKRDVAAIAMLEAGAGRKNRRQGTDETVEIGVRPEAVLGRLIE